MDTEEEAREYDAMDHSEVNARFVHDLLTFVGRHGARADRDGFDVGNCGQRHEFRSSCARASRRSATVVAIDLADHMLALARSTMARANLEARIALEKRDAKSAGWPDGRFDVVISNTILHHIPDPTDLVREMWRLTARGGAIFLERSCALRDGRSECVRPRRNVRGGAPATDDPA